MRQPSYINTPGMALVVDHRLGHRLTDERRLFEDRPLAGVGVEALTLLDAEVGQPVHEEAVAVGDGFFLEHFVEESPEGEAARLVHHARSCGRRRR